MLSRRYRVHVKADHGVAHVRLVRWFSTITDYISVAKVNLLADDGEDRLADARARAVSLAHQVNRLERDRL